MSSHSDSEPQLLSITEDLVPARLPIVPSITPIDFDRLLNPPLILQDDPTQCGGQLWPGGMVLAKYLLQQKMSDLQGKTILELGSGSGLVGLSLALSSPHLSSVHLTDLPAILPLLQHNRSLNTLLSPTHISVLPWGSDSLSTSISTPSSPDIILAADCCYFEPSFPLLLATLQQLLRQDSVCYFCFKKRRRADIGFVKKARKVFDVRAVEDDPDREVWQRKGIHLFEIRAKGHHKPHEISKAEVEKPNLQLL
ncbi:MAG: hypothetical protein Q9190_006607 [Brigantiaea leucoxantha]